MKYVADICGFAKQRPRFAKGKSGGNFIYLDIKYRQRQWKLLMSVKPAIVDARMPELKADICKAPGKYLELVPIFLEEVLFLKVDFYFNRSTRCDVDNLIGGLMDTFNGILWTDDNQIKKIQAEVFEYAGFNKIEFVVGELIQKPRVCK